MTTGRIQVDPEALAQFAAEMRGSSTAYFEQFATVCRYAAAAHPRAPPIAAPGVMAAWSEVKRKMGACLSGLATHMEWRARIAAATEQMSRNYLSSDASSAKRLAEVE